MASMAQVNMRMIAARQSVPATALAARANVLLPPPVSRKLLKQEPMIREKKWLQNMVKSKLYGMNGGYEEYGSTDGDWRNVAIAKGSKLPIGYTPRRSKRLRARTKTTK